MVGLLCCLVFCLWGYCVDGLLVCWAAVFFALLDLLCSLRLLCTGLIFFAVGLLGVLC